MTGSKTVVCVCDMFRCALCILTGISQLPALFTLLRLYNADVNLCNVDGMTPLMLAASFGDCILVNVSYCIIVATVLHMPSGIL